MYSLLLAVIYLIFISLGLPDSLIGSAWPVMHLELDVSMSYMGVLTIVIAAGTIVSSLNSDRLTKRFGVAVVVVASIFLSAVSLIGYSLSTHFWMLCLWALPYGLAAGAIDAAINNYVALHYKSSHMSWLHCFWGVGVSISPYIMSFALLNNMGWNSGFRFVSYIQVVLAFIVLANVSLFKKVSAMQCASVDVAVENIEIKFKDIIQIKGVKLTLFTFFCYCALESTAGIWASSYLVEVRGVEAEIAARYASYFFIGITFGRFISGFIADKFGDNFMIGLGEAIILIGCVMLFIQPISLFGLIVIGVGCAPIYPAIIHSTPANFGQQFSQSIIGVEMASAYTGVIFAPAIFGLIADWFSMSLYPVFLLCVAVLMLISSYVFKRQR
ncbi:MAG: MFS transporter [Epulopiscium sp. Nuni2H_MBin001]|nr:MAG: MFS transporter [Epulopiscium sp. Nuni2H_MBin001]